MWHCEYAWIAEQIKGVLSKASVWHKQLIHFYSHSWLLGSPQLLRLLRIIACLSAGCHAMLPRAHLIWLTLTALGARCLSCRKKLSTVDPYIVLVAKYQGNRTYLQGLTNPPYAAIIRAQRLQQHDALWLSFHTMARGLHIYLSCTSLLEYMVPVHHIPLCRLHIQHIHQLNHNLPPFKCW